VDADIVDAADGWLMLLLANAAFVVHRFHDLQAVTARPALRESDELLAVVAAACRVDSATFLPRSDDPVVAYRHRSSPCPAACTLALRPGPTPAVASRLLASDPTCGGGGGGVAERRVTLACTGDGACVLLRHANCVRVCDVEHHTADCRRSPSVAA